MSVLCNYVTPLESTCKPTEKSVDILTVDATKSNDPKEIVFNVLIGSSIKSDLSKEEKSQHKFYSEFIEGEPNGQLLFNNFKQKLGNSSITGYDWTSTLNSKIWTSQKISKNLKFQVDAACLIKYSQVVGECGYFTVNTDMLIKTIICDNGTSGRNNEMIGKD